MNYKLTITRTAPNPNYESLMKAYTEASERRYGGMMPEMPQKNIEMNVLNVEVTEKQFEAIRAEVIKTF